MSAESSQGACNAMLEEGASPHRCHQHDCCTNRSCRTKSAKARRCQLAPRPSGWAAALVLCLLLHQASLVSCQELGPFRECYEASIPTRCQPEGSPVSLGRPVTANSTCGTPPNTFCERTNFLSLQNIQLDCTQVCNASDPDLSHPPRYIVDFDHTGSFTSWISDVLPTEQDIVIDIPFSDHVEIELINIRFSSFKAESLYIERSTDFGQSYQTYHYFSMSCESTYGVTPDVIAPASNEQQPLCTSFRDPRPGVLSFVPTSLRPSANDSLLGVSEEVYQFLTATNIRIVLDQQYVVAGMPPDDPEFAGSYYYGVSDVTVIASRQCFGHASTLNLTLSGESVCSCRHNTAGDHCERCLDFYQDVPWQRHLASEPFECKMCDCNDHSSECVFNASVYEATGRVSGGVCVNCMHNTAGRQCEQCAPFYYPDPTKRQTDIDVCIECGCHLPGVRNNGDCSRVAVEGVVVGDCSCKNLTMGRTCSQCVPGYFNLTADNSLGCQDCLCHPLGSLSASCHSVTGVCSCQDNVMGDKCDMCRPGYFNLSSTGCQTCGCVSGASFSDVCDSTGQCPCRRGVTGRTCSQTEAGQFYPALDYLTVEAEFGQVGMFQLVYSVSSVFTGRGAAGVDVGSSVNFGSVGIPRSGDYSLTIRYSLSNIDAWQAAQLTVTPGDEPGEPVLTCSNEITMATTLPYTTWMMGIGQTLSSQVCLRGGRSYEVVLEIMESGRTLDSADVQFLIDSLVVLPVGVADLQVFQESPALLTLYSSCLEARTSVITRVTEPEGCRDLIFSVTTEIFNGTLACDCGIGASDAVCEAYGGQCPCEPQVVGRDCSFCRATSFGISESGCSACMCDPRGSENEICDFESGQCPCLPFVAGRTCSQCEAGYYNLTSVLGCQQCTCGAGATDVQCDMVTGECGCQVGVSGPTCDVCLPQYFNFTPAGCSACSCSPSGSLSVECNASSGQCLCKLLTTGSRDCATCTEGSFNLQSTNPLGCQPCFCSGHTSQCSSAAGFIAGVVAALITDGSREPWDLLSSAFQPTGFLFYDPIEGRVTYLHGLGAYFSAPPEYLGNKLSSYGQPLSVTLGLGSNDTLPDGPPPAGLYDVVVTGSNGVSIAAFFLSVPTLEPVTSSIRIQEDSGWILTSTSDLATARDILSVLSDISLLAVRLEFDNPAATSIVLYNFTLATALPAESGDPEVTWVEECGCPVNFTGLSCEQCASGYFHAADGSCQPCDCGGFSVSCDPDTGACTNCSALTTGVSCERCVDGAFGDPASGTPCLPCPCPLTSSPGQFSQTCRLLPNTSVECLDCPIGHVGLRCEMCDSGFFGDPTGNRTGTPTRCSDCQCSGNIDPSDPASCDQVSGECHLCTGNTAGTQCELCANGYFGDAVVAKNCTECGCDPAGSISAVCNAETGQCDCQPNVRGRTCSACNEYHFGLASGSGCSPCDCHPEGSNMLQCDVITGNCTCQPLVTGRTCNECTTGAYELTSSGCTACDCDLIGSTRPHCSSPNGQCDCRQGFIGLKCSQCAEAFFVQEGQCEACPGCYQQLQSAINTTLEQLANTTAALSNVSSNISNIPFSERLSAVQATVAALNTRVINIQANDSTLQSMIASLATSLSSIEQQVRHTVFQLGLQNNSISTIAARSNAILSIIRSVEDLLIQGVDLLEDMASRGNAVGNTTLSMENLMLSADMLTIDLTRHVQLLRQQDDRLQNISTSAAESSSEAASLTSMAVARQQGTSSFVASLLTNTSASKLYTQSLVASITEALVQAADVRSLVEVLLTMPFFPPSEDLIASTSDLVATLFNQSRTIQTELASLSSTLSSYQAELQGAERTLERLTYNTSTAEDMALNLLQRAQATFQSSQAVLNATDALLAVAQSTVMVLEDFSGRTGAAQAAAEAAMQQLALVQQAANESLQLSVEVLHSLGAALRTAYNASALGGDVASQAVEIEQALLSVNLTGPLQSALQAERDAVALAARISTSLASIRATYDQLNDTAADVRAGEAEVSVAEAQAANITSSEVAVTSAVSKLLQSVNATTPSNDTSLAELHSSISETMALLSSADIGRIVEELEEALDAQRANTRQLQQELESVEDEFSKLQSLFASLPTSCDDNV